MLRYSIPVLQGLRGVGFGNEVIPWGKAFIGAQELNLRPLHPAWALNPRGYRHDFSTSILDWPAQQALKILPKLVVDADSAAQYDDYADVVRGLRGRVSDRGPVAVMHSSGMSGGYYGIRRARQYLRAAVTKPRHVAGDLYSIEERLTPGNLTVALHIRAGDFMANVEGPEPGRFNTMLPIDWYAAVGRNLQTAFAGRVHFLIFTDDENNPAIEALAKELDAVPLPVRAKPLLSDIAAMSSADLLVCSVSSLSMFAAFISEKPYIWYGPHLGEIGGFKSIWGHEENQRQGLTATNAADADPLLTRGTAIDANGELPEDLAQHLVDILAIKNQRYDLIMYGVVR